MFMCKHYKMFAFCRHKELLSYSFHSMHKSRDTSEIIITYQLKYYNYNARVWTTNNIDVTTG